MNLLTVDRLVNLGLEPDGVTLSGRILIINTPDFDIQLAGARAAQEFNISNAASDSFLSKINKAFGDLALVEFNQREGVVIAAAFSRVDIENELGIERGEDFQADSSRKLFIFGKMDIASYARIIRAVNDAGFDKERVFVKRGDKLWINTRSGEFSLSEYDTTQASTRNPPSSNPIRQTPHFKSPDEFFEFLSEQFSIAENGTPPDDNEYLRTSNWSAIADFADDVIQVENPYNAADSKDSVAEQERKYNLFREIYRQIDGQRNIPGLTVSIDGKDYVWLHAPLIDGETISKDDAPGPLTDLGKLNEIEYLFVKSTHNPLCLIAATAWKSMFSFDPKLLTDS